jgi:hypothetical protein
MFSVKCIKTGKTLILDQTTVLIILRQFDDGYNRFSHVCNCDEAYHAYEEDNLLYIIKCIK